MDNRHLFFSLHVVQQHAGWPGVSGGGEAGRRAERRHQEGFGGIARPLSEDHSFGWLFLRRTPARTPARLPAAFPQTPSGRPSSDPT